MSQCLDVGAGRAVAATGGEAEGRDKPARDRVSIEDAVQGLEHSPRLQEVMRQASSWPDEYTPWHKFWLFLRLGDFEVIPRCRPPPRTAAASLRCPTRADRRVVVPWSALCARLG